jgi:chitin disaccharide deacetylase
VIEDLETVLAASGQPALAELRTALGQVLDAGVTPVACIEQSKLKSRVHRLRFQVRGRVRSVVAKRLEPEVARRGELLVRRWLPAEGLEYAAPRLIASTPAAGGWVWHVYEDLGEETLEHRPEGDRVDVALRLVARLHARFTSHALLEECRAVSEERGMAYFMRNVREAIAALEALRGPEAVGSATHAALRDRLLARLHRLEAETPVRSRAFADSGELETLLHGDLWTSNVVVTRSIRGLEPKLLDWDRLGPGPASYDLSAFLLRFPRERRLGIMELIDRAIDSEGGRPLERQGLAMNLETAELSRYANRVIWPARAIAGGRLTAGYTELAEVERWFEALNPVLDFPALHRAPAPKRARRPPAHDRSTSNKLLIVNADDFGATSGVNRGILEAHERGIVTSTSLMVEMPAAEEAAAASRAVPGLGIGLHVDLGRTPPADAAGIHRILMRQADRFEALMGRKPTHIDSHRNAHLQPEALPEFRALARRLRIPLRGHARVRLLSSFYGQWHGESHPEQVGVASLLRMLATRVEPGITELMCHPAYVDSALDSSYRSEREVERVTLCDPAIRRALAEHDIRLVGFADLSRLRRE